MTGPELKELREKLGMTQHELAMRLGYRHKIRISEMERPRASHPVPRLVGLVVRAWAREAGLEVADPDYLND